MNILLWVLQIVLAVLCISGGVFQIFKLDELKKNTTAMRKLPRSFWAFMGAFGCVAGLGLILPGAINVQPGLAPFAAAAVAVQSVLISGIYIYNGDKAPLPYSLAMAIMGAFISYGRFALP